MFLVLTLPVFKVIIDSKFFTVFPLFKIFSGMYLWKVWKIHLSNCLFLRHFSSKGVIILLFKFIAYQQFINFFCSSDFVLIFLNVSLMFYLFIFKRNSVLVFFYSSLLLFYNHGFLCIFSFILFPQICSVVVFPNFFC